MLAVSVVIGTLGGVYADRRLGTTPWLTLLGIALGMAAGFTGVFRTLRDAGRPAEDRDDREGRKRPDGDNETR